MLRTNNSSYLDAKYIHEHLSEKEKESDSYLIGNVEYTIASLVKPKVDLRTAADYYHGHMDKSQYKYLEDNFGIGTACDLEFIPLVRSHIEALKGQLLSNPMKFGITCTDEKTLKSMEEEKKLSAHRELMDKLRERLRITNDHIKKYMSGDQFKGLPEKLGEEWAGKVIEDFNTTWLSAFDKAAQTVLNDVLLNPNIDFKAKMVQMFENLLVYGSCYYRAKIENEGDAPTIEVINPLHIFYNKNMNDVYVKYATRVAYRFYRTPEELINMFPEMTEEEIEYVTSHGSKGYFGGELANEAYARDILHNLAGNTDYYNNESGSHNLIECFHVEWLANNEIEVDDYSEGTRDKQGNLISSKIKRYRLDRYSAYRIGPRLYLRAGKDKAIRSQAAPYKCQLSYNGASYTDVNGKPYSLVLKTKSLQDKYNIYYFLRDNVIHNSGVKGQYVELSMLPTFLGSSPKERYIAAIASAKQGHMPLNSSQEGSSQMNTIFQGFDNTLEYNTIQAYDMVLARIEETVSQITGVTKPMLGDIEQREAVGNVQVSMRQSMVINKPLFSIMDSIMRQCLTDIIDLSKIAFTGSRYGSMLLGDYSNKVFTIEPRYFRFSDHAVYVVDNDRIKESKDKIESLVMNMVTAGMITPVLAFEVMEANSISEAKDKAEKGMRMAQNHNEQIQMAQQKIQELEQQLKQALAQAKQTDENQKALNQAKIQEINGKLKISEEQLKIEQERLKTDKEVAMNQLKLEAVQMVNGNKQDDEPKNIRL